jgi:hypothetical protein
MEISPIVRLHAFVTVEGSDWEVFKQMVAATKLIVKGEGPEHVLTHECYYQPDSYDCLIIEAYKDEHAFLNHLELIKPLSERYTVRWKVNRLELCGPFSESTVNIWRNAGIEVAFFETSLPN